MKKRVIAFVDGFNVYHSVVELGPELNHCKWLDLNSLVRALVHPNSDELIEVQYFTSDAHWNTEEKRKRHSDYLAALRLTGVTTTVGAFKKVRRKCNRCLKTFAAYEENGTDVAIAAQMVRFAHEDRFDKAFLFSADSDLVPIVKNIKQSHPHIEIYIVTTSSRIRNAKDLRQNCDGYIQLDSSNFEKNLLGATIESGSIRIVRPVAYQPPVQPPLAGGL